MAGIYVSWRGNRKLSWPTFNLPAVKTCPGSTAECRRTCYALKAEKMYPAVLPCRLGNLENARDKGFAAGMATAINNRKKRPTVFRIHESGDFFSEKYFRQWCAIASACPDVTFFAFTKVFALFDIPRPDNFTLIASVFPDTDRESVPDSVPTFEAVPKGETSTGTQCLGSCDDCGICPKAGNNLRVWCEIH